MLATQEQLEEWRKQADKGRRVEAISDPLNEYLDDVRRDTIRELERTDIIFDHMERMQSRLVVIKAIRDSIKKDIDNGRIAEKMLREAEI